ncbi:alpha/beta fold hydrolase [Pedobacter nyackensis]|uniref:alpha/beta fold hydrolase n=1 Tax=Pedobacter nyackensis TaxID=475255 RepID=UPI00135658C7|nr:alpha/beta hydrolase [Pedobacter nyackensis]
MQLEAVNGQAKKEPLTIQVYSSAKKEFLAFERSHGGSVQTRNVSMHYLSWGNPGNPCLIWAHGSMNSGYEFLDIADSLVKAGYYVIAIDYYGHGQTPIPDHEVSIYHVADDIKFLMDKLSIEKAFVGGFSRGGCVATAFYDSYPKNVLGLILEDGGSVAANTYYQKLDSEKLEQISKKFDLKQAIPWDRTFPTQFEAFNSLYDSNEIGNQFPIFALLKENKTGGWGVIYSEMMNLFNLENRHQFSDLILRPSRVPLFARSMVIMEPQIIFRNLCIPVLILDPVSDNDSMPFEKENEALKKAHPNFITYIVYPNTEHNIHYAHPARFTKDLLGFLDESYKKERTY